MLKMIAKLSDGRDLIVLGLSRNNIAKLQAGVGDNFIRVVGSEIGVPAVDILIFAGDTEQSMMQEVSELIGPETRVAINKRLTN